MYETTNLSCPPPSMQITIMINSSKMDSSTDMQVKKSQINHHISCIPHGKGSVKGDRCLSEDITCNAKYMACGKESIVPVRMISCREMNYVIHYKFVKPLETNISGQSVKKHAHFDQKLGVDQGTTTDFNNILKGDTTKARPLTQHHSPHQVLVVKEVLEIKKYKGNKHAMIYSSSEQIMQGKTDHINNIGEPEGKTKNVSGTFSAFYPLSITIPINPNLNKINRIRIILSLGNETFIRGNRKLEAEKIEDIDTKQGPDHKGIQSLNPKKVYNDKKMVSVSEALHAVKEFLTEGEGEPPMDIILKSEKASVKHFEADQSQPSKIESKIDTSVKEPKINMMDNFSPDVEKSADPPKTKSSKSLPKMKSSQNKVALCASKSKEERQGISEKKSIHKDTIASQVDSKDKIQGASGLTLDQKETASMTKEERQGISEKKAVHKDIKVSQEDSKDKTQGVSGLALDQKEIATVAMEERQGISEKKAVHKDTTASQVESKDKIQVTSGLTLDQKEAASMTIEPTDDLQKTSNHIMPIPGSRSIGINPENNIEIKDQDVLPFISPETKSDSIQVIFEHDIPEQKHPFEPRSKSQKVSNIGEIVEGIIPLKNDTANKSSINKAGSIGRVDEHNIPKQKHPFEPSSKSQKVSNIGEIVEGIIPLKNDTANKSSINKPDSIGRVDDKLEKNSSVSLKHDLDSSGSMVLKVASKNKSKLERESKKIQEADSVTSKKKSNSDSKKSVLLREKGEVCPKPRKKDKLKSNSQTSKLENDDTLKNIVCPSKKSANNETSEKALSIMTLPEILEEVWIDNETFEKIPSFERNSSPKEKSIRKTSSADNHLNDQHLKPTRSPSVLSENKLSLKKAKSEKSENNASVIEAQKPSWVQERQFTANMGNNSFDMNGQRHRDKIYEQEAIIISLESNDSSSEDSVDPEYENTLSLENKTTPVDGIYDNNKQINNVNIVSENKLVEKDERGPTGLTEGLTLSAHTNILPSKNQTKSHFHAMKKVTLNIIKTSNERRFEIKEKKVSEIFGDVVQGHISTASKDIKILTGRLFEESKEQSSCAVGERNIRRTHTSVHQAGNLFKEFLKTKDRKKTYKGYKISSNMNNETFKNDIFKDKGGCMNKTMKVGRRALEEEGYKPFTKLINFPKLQKRNTKNGCDKISTEDLNAGTNYFHSFYPLTRKGKRKATKISLGTISEVKESDEEDSTKIEKDFANTFTSCIEDKVIQEYEISLEVLNSDFQQKIPSSNQEHLLNRYERIEEFSEPIQILSSYEDLCNSEIDSNCKEKVNKGEKEAISKRKLSTSSDWRIDRKENKQSIKTSVIVARDRKDIKVPMIKGDNENLNYVENSLHPMIQKKTNKVYIFLREIVPNIIFVECLFQAEPLALSRLSMRENKFETIKSEVNKNAFFGNENKPYNSFQILKELQDQIISDFLEASCRNVQRLIHDIDFGYIPFYYNDHKTYINILDLRRSIEMCLSDESKLNLDQ